MNDDKERIRFLVLVLVIAGFSAALYAMFKPFLPAISWAVVLSVALMPLYRKLVILLRGRKSLAAFLMSVFMFLAIIVAVLPVSVSLLQEMSVEAAKVEEFLNENPRFLEEKLGELPYFKNKDLSQYFSREGSSALARETLQQYYRPMLTVFKSAASGTLTVVAQCLFCLIFCYLFFVYGQSIAKTLTGYAQYLGGDKLRAIMMQARDTIKGAVLGVVATAFFQGLLAGIGFAVAGTPAPILFGFLISIFSFIPMGAPIVYMPLIAYLGFTAPWYYAAGLFVWCVGIVSTSDNVFRSLFISQATSLPMLLIFLSIIGGVLAFGLLGVILGPVLIAILLTPQRTSVEQ
ncbi:MAG: AI-2E family transporter [Deltaproteobacteria bacterium]|nr:AI-2E family transporter [Deltaproteobacteria bacterium]